MLYRRPFALCCIVFVLGIALCTFWDEYRLFWLLTGAVISAACFLLIGQSKRFIIPAAVFACFAFGTAVFSFHAFFVDKSVPYGTSGFKGEVRDVNTGDENRYIELKTEKINGISYSVRLYGADKEITETVCNNDILYVKCGDSAWRKPTNKMKADGIDAYCFGKAEIVEKDAAKGFMPFVLRVKSFFMEASGSAFSDDTEASGWVNALIFGDNRGVSEKSLISLRRTGASHLICVSGLHFSILMGAVISLLMHLGIRKKIRTVICVLFAASYTLLVGLPVSALRASFMCVMTFAAELTLRKRDSLTLLFASLAVIVLFETYAIYDIGAQFSFLSCAALIILSDSTDDAISLLNRNNGRTLRVIFGYVVMPLLFVLFATLFNLPVMLLNFDYFSVVSPLSNLVSSLIVPAIMVLSLITLMLNGIIPFLGAISAKITSVLISAFKNTVTFLADQKASCISTYIPGIRFLSLFTVAAILIAMLLKKKQRRISYLVCGLAFAVSVPAIIMLSNALNSGKTVISCTDSTDRSVMVRSGGDVFWLDSGKNESSAEFIYKNGCSSVKYYVTGCADEQSLERFKELTSGIYIENVIFTQSYYTDSVLKEIEGCFGGNVNIAGDTDEITEYSLNGAEITLFIGPNGDTYDLTVRRGGKLFAYAESEGIAELISGKGADILDISNCSGDIEYYVSDLVTDGAQIIRKEPKDRRYSFIQRALFTADIYDSGKITINNYSDKNNGEDQ